MAERFGVGVRFAASVAVVAWLAAFTPVRGQDPPENLPMDALRAWQDFNNAGWKALDRADYRRAGQAFGMAIEALLPHQASAQRLLARSYNDLARVLYHQQRYDEAEPLARWALAVRDVHPRVKREDVFKSLFLVAQVERARGRAAEAEPLFRRALAAFSHHVVSEPLRWGI